MAREFDSSATLGVAISIAFFVLLVGFVRAFNWWFTAGRTMVGMGESVTVRGRFRTVRISPKEVKSVSILSGEWRPEWSRWAVHPVIVFELWDGRRISRQVLLDSDGVLREGPRLQAVIVQAAGRREGGSDTELGEDKST